MKRLSRVLAVAVVAFLVPLGVSLPASAVATCEIGFTGPDSNNLCTSLETYQCTVTNTNIVEITNSNNQVVASGTVAVGGNTTGGTGTSGSVSNNNGTTFTVSITNANPESEENGICTATVTVPPTETPETVQPTQPRQASSAPIRSLPVTSGESSLYAAAIVAAAVAISAVTAAGALLVYRHFHKS